MGLSAIDTASARGGDRLDQNGLGVDDQKQWFARTFVLESNNREEPKTFTYVISNDLQQFLDSRFANATTSDLRNPLLKVRVKLLAIGFL